jgi:hypothetical protein
LKIPYIDSEFGKNRIAGFFFLAFALLWTVGSFWHVHSEHLRHAELVRQNACSVVEGRVEHFSPMPYAGHANESFSVAGVDFHYSDFNVTDAFNNAASHGGPIDATSYVRICYDPQDNSILRLEIRGFAGEVPDYASWSSLIPWSSPDHGPVAWLFSYGGLMALLFVLDVIAIERLLLPYVRTFLRIGAQSGLNQRLPIALEGERKLELGNSTIYWDRAEHAIWLRPRGFNLVQVPSMVAKLTVDRMDRAITGFEIRYSSGALIVLGLLALIFDLFAFGMARGHAPVIGLVVVGIFAVVTVVTKLRTMRSRMQTLVDEAIGELGTM